MAKKVSGMSTMMSMDDEPGLKTISGNGGLNLATLLFVSDHVLSKNSRFDNDHRVPKVPFG